jgi:hypothetical protein
MKAQPMAIVVALIASLQIAAGQPLRFSAEILRELPLEKGNAQQGITITDRFSYTAENNYLSSTDRRIVSYIHLRNRTNFSLIKTKAFSSSNQKIWDDLSSYTCHIGQVAENPADRFMYATFLDPSAQRTALLKFDPETLEILEAIDTTPVYGYSDAIAFDKEGRIWLNHDSGFTSLKWSGLVQVANGRQRLNPMRAQWEQKLYSYDSSLFSVPQGLQVTEGRVYVVPENDVENKRTKAENNGIIVFLTANLKPYTEGRLISSPDYIFPFQLPRPGEADHESFAFDPFDRGTIWISSGDRDGDRLWKIRLREHP